MRHAIPLFLISTAFWANGVFALECGSATGRVDVQRAGAADWTSLSPGLPLPASTTFRLANEAQSTLSLGTGLQMVIRGPSQIHMMQLPGLDGGKPDLTWNDWKGAMDLEVKDSSVREIRGNCGPLQVQAQHAKAVLHCSPDSGRLLVTLQSGQATVSRSAEYGITLEAGKTWIAYFDSTWGRDTVMPTPKELQPSPAPDSNSLVRLVWDGTLATAVSQRWNLRSFLAQSAEGLPTTLDSIKTPWTAHLHVDDFTIRPGNGIWTIDVHISCTITQRNFAPGNSTRVWVRHIQVADTDPNRLEMLRLLPLDIHNTRMHASAFATLHAELHTWLQNTVFNPFARSGMATPAP